MNGFAWKYVRWRGRMAFNLMTEKREYLALAIGVGVISVVGGLAHWHYSSNVLSRLLTEASPQEADRILGLLVFSLYVAFALMALANVITRFFGSPRMDEREQLMGPLEPNVLFATELLDTLQLPFLILVFGVVAPLVLAFLKAGLPLWLLVVVASSLVLLLVQPTLIVMGLYIAVIRFLPRKILGRRLLLFVFFTGVALIGGGALDTIRQLFVQQRTEPLRFPSSWVGAMAPLYLEGQVVDVWLQAVRVLVLTSSILVVTFLLYRRAFLERLELFADSEPGAVPEMGAPGWVRRVLFRLLSQPVAAIVHKDLRSTRRDSAQRIAFTALAAVIFSLVVLDLATGQTRARPFLLIFAPYALFLVSCQGLSTFSAEGGVLENLAQLPLEAPHILKAKVFGHFLLFVGVIGVSLGLMALAPGGLPIGWRILGAALVFPFTLPLAAILAWVSVILGAIFPKPGEGGGRKEISIFAMGLYFQLLTLLALSLAAAGVMAVFFDPVYALAVPVVVAIWWYVLRFLHALALRSVNRALGAEMRAG